MKISDKKMYTRSLAITAIFLVGYFLALALFALNKECWHDECHFVETIHQFNAQPTLNTLKHYNEMSTPLPFIIYAGWEKIVGDTLAELRILSIIIAFATYLVFHYLYFLAFQNSRYSILLTIFLASIPYMAGAAVFIFTDMLMMLCLALFITGVIKKNGWLVWVAGAAGLLCRQYLVFIIIAGIAYCCAGLLVKKDKKTIPLLLGMVFSAVPLCLLFLLWGGISPQNEIRKLYLCYKLSFNFQSVTLYVIQTLVYLFPVLLFSWRRFYSAKSIFAALIIAGVYFLSPVGPSPCAVAAAVDTVGNYHVLLRRMAGKGYEQAVFFALFLAALPIIITIVKNSFSRIRSREITFSLFLELSIFSFFLVMPFSYLHWEKYFLPMVPLMSLYMLLSARQSAITLKKSPRISQDKLVK